MATLDGVDLGNVERIIRNKNTNLIPFSLIDGQKVAKLLGIERTLNVIGSYTGTTSDIQSFIDDIEGRADGSTFTSIVFRSDETDRSGSGLDVFIQEFQWEWEGVPSNRINWQLNLLEVDSTT